MADDKTYKALANVHRDLSKELDRFREILDFGENIAEDYVRARLGLPPDPLIDGAERAKRNRAEVLTQIKRQAERLILTVSTIEQYEHALDYIGCVSEQY